MMSMAIAWAFASISAETAAGAWPEEAVTIMHRIAAQVEADPGYAARVHFIETLPDPTTADALAQAAASIANTLPIAGIIVFTGSGSTARRVARERPGAPMLVMDIAAAQDLMDRIADKVLDGGDLRMATT